MEDSGRGRCTYGIVPQHGHKCLCLAVPAVDQEVGAPLDEVRHMLPVAGACVPICERCCSPCQICHLCQGVLAKCQPMRALKTLSNFRTFLKYWLNRSMEIAEGVL